MGRPRDGRWAHPPSARSSCSEGPDQDFERILKDFGAPIAGGLSSPVAWLPPSVVRPRRCKGPNLASAGKVMDFFSLISCVVTKHIHTSSKQAGRPASEPVSRLQKSPTHTQTQKAIHVAAATLPNFFLPSRFPPSHLGQAPGPRPLPVGSGTSSRLPTRVSGRTAGTDKGTRAPPRLRRLPAPRGGRS